MSTITRRASLRKQARDNLLNLDEAIELIVALEAERDEARAEEHRHRERANEAKIAWLMHEDHDCALKCCREIEEALGTVSPVEGARKVRELRAEIARQQALIGSLMGGTGGPGP